MGGLVHEHGRLEPYPRTVYYVLFCYTFFVLQNDEIAPFLALLPSPSTAAEHDEQ